MTKSLKADFLDSLIGLDHAEVKQMLEVDVDDVSAVDDPATGRVWRMFKRRKQSDFPGLGSGAPGRPGGNSSLVDLARFLERNPTMTPAAAEAAEDGNEGLVAALRDDFNGAGDDATVSDPPTAGDFVSAKLVGLVRQAAAAGEKKHPPGVDVATFDRCVQHIIDNIEAGSLVPDDPDMNPKSVGYAICTATGAGKTRKEAEPMGRKQDEPGIELDMEQAPPAVAEVLEVPASPTKWPFAQCVSDAQEVGLGEDNAIGVCQLIRADLKDPEDEETILLPDGTTPESLIMAAGMQLGLMKPEGAGGGGGGGMAEGELHAPKFRFTGRNRWSRKLRAMLGLERPPTMDERRLARMEREVSTLVKSNRDLMTIIDRQQQIIAHAIGLTGLPRLVEDEPAPVASPPAPAAVADSAVAAAVAPAGDGKRAKAEGDQPLTEDERAELERLRQLEAELKAGAGESDPALHARFEAPEDLGPSEPAPTPEPEMVGASVVGKLMPRAKRQSVAPATISGKNGKVEMVYSSILGTYIPKGDREAFGS